MTSVGGRLFEQGQALLYDLSSSLVEVGARLRQVREQRGLSQTDFATLAGVKRGSQTEYESGKRPFDIAYLLRLMADGMDAQYILTGRRSVDCLDAQQRLILEAYQDMDPSDQKVITQVACSFAGLKPPAPPITLPSSEALEDAMSGLLEEGTQWTPAALVHEIARSLPTILRSAEDEIAVPASDQPGTARALRAIADVDQPSTRQGTRT